MTARSRLAAIARPYLPRFAAGFLLLLVTNGLGLWIPWLLRDAIRAMERRAELRVIGGFAAAIAAVALLQAAVRTGSRLVLLGASRRIAFDLRERYFDRLLRLGGGFFDRRRTGDIMSRGVNDVRLVQAFYGPGVMNLLNTTIVYVAVLVLLLRIDVRLTLISLLLYPPLFFGVNRLSRGVYARSRSVQEQLAEIANRAQENVSGIQQVKIYVQEQREIEAFRALSAEYRRLNLSLAALRGGMVSLIGVISGLGTLVVLFVGGRSVIDGRIDLGAFVAFHAYLGLLVWPTIALGWILNTLQRGVGAMERIAEVLHETPEVPSPLDEPAQAIDPLDGDLEFRGLCFRYPVPGHDPRGRRRPALRDIDLSIPRGSRVALVGPVGAGKSTLVDLLARFYAVPPGTIFVGGRDVTEIPSSVLRRSLGYVPQEAFLFSRTLRENVALGDPDAAEAAIDAAVTVARLEGDLQAFPRGLETRVGERGFTLSGGQRQRVSLARALVGDHPILVLDDSLSSVDADTERAILDRLGPSTRGRTLLLISHRPSTLQGMDRIVVLDEGRIVEDGTHAELLARQGLYARLFRRHLLEERLAGS